MSRSFTTRRTHPHKFSGIEFRLNPSQVRLLNRWIKDVHAAAADQQIRDMQDGTRRIPYLYVPYYGAIGGGLTFRFVPTGVGLGCSVTEAITGRTLNLSDYEDW
jgi:hypothetical protein